MSSSITVKLLKDEQKIEDGVILLEMYTTPTRELAGSVSLEYDGNMFEPEEEEDPLGGYVYLTKEKIRRDFRLLYYFNQFS